MCIPQHGATAKEFKFLTSSARAKLSKHGRVRKSSPPRELLAEPRVWPAPGELHTVVIYNVEAF